MCTTQLLSCTKYDYYTQPLRKKQQNSSLHSCYLVWKVILHKGWLLCTMQLIACTKCDYYIQPLKKKQNISLYSCNLVQSMITVLKIRKMYKVQDNSCEERCFVVHFSIYQDNSYIAKYNCFFLKVFFYSNHTLYKITAVQ